MEILITLPASSSINTYKELKAYLKQLELAVHHAQKSVDSAEENGVLMTDSSFANFEHKSLSEEMQDDFYEELQNVELRISLN